MSAPPGSVLPPPARPRRNLSAARTPAPLAVPLPAGHDAARHGRFARRIGLLRSIRAIMGWRVPNRPHEPNHPRQFLTGGSGCGTMAVSGGCGRWGCRRGPGPWHPSRSERYLPVPRCPSRGERGLPRLWWVTLFLRALDRSGDRLAGRLGRGRVVGDAMQRPVAQRWVGIWPGGRVRHDIGPGVL